MAHGVTIGAEGDEVVGAVSPTLTAGDVVVDLGNRVESQRAQR